MIMPKVLYHGSNTEVREPGLGYSRRELDFGMGFYLTSDYDQAARWAKRVARLRKTGEASINLYDIDCKLWSELSVLRFEGADHNWLRFVVNNRLGIEIEEEYDVVVGPLADDRTIDVINGYIAGRFDEDIALRLLLPMKYKDQWAMRTERSLDVLSFKGVITL